MSTYIGLVNYTEQGIRTIKGSSRRLNAAKKLAKDLGGSIKQFFLTMGAYDIVVVLDFPDDAAAAKFALALGSLGNVRTMTLKAFPEPEYRKILHSLS